MKRLKKILALALAMAMVVAMALPAMAEEQQAGKGSITINSPIMGAQYKAYKVFDLAMDNASAPTAYAYTIKSNSPFYKAVKSYADANPTELQLAENNKAGEVTTYDVTGDGLDAQKFGKYLQARMAESYEGADKITGATGKDPDYGEDAATHAAHTEITVDTASAVTVKNLDYGYYLITNNYDDPEARKTVTLKKSNGDVIGTFSKDSTADEIATAAQTYAEDKYPDATAAEAYVSAHADQFKKTWDKMTQAEKDKVLSDLQASTKQNAIDQINNAIRAAASDDNARPTTERFVFVDSTNPNAVINEKNEIEKWDEPVNPDGSADLPDVPDHDEPKGGKNIIVGETTDHKKVYGDTIETNIGDKVKYELSINAVNFERDKNDKVQQIKEYIIADYENKNMKFVTEDGLKVSIVKKDKDGNITQKILEDADYTSWVNKGYFFTNKDKVDMDGGDVFNKGDEDKTARGGGIVIPWVKEITAEEYASGTYNNVKENTVDKMEDGQIVYQKGVEPYKEENGIRVDANNNKVDANGYLLDADGHQIPETEKKYFASLYPDDVTILVNYTMELLDTAVIAGDGNKNTSQFGVNYLDDEDREYKPAQPNTPPDNPKNPDEKKTPDDAKVYTYAIAIKKVDDEGKNLAGAKFKLRGVTAVEKSKGWYKVSAYDHKATAAFGTELETDDDGILVVEGLPTKWEVEIQETVAPVGFNKLQDSTFITPKKVSEETTASSTVTYTDEEGNTTSVTTTTTTYKKGANVVAFMEKIGDRVKYYLDETKTTEIDEARFNSQIDKFKNVDATDVITNGDIAEISVVNNKGTELPSTGGIGTTIFYVVGAILVIGAGVVLITKRRMEA